MPSSSAPDGSAAASAPWRLAWTPLVSEIATAHRRWALALTPFSRAVRVGVLVLIGLLLVVASRGLAWLGVWVLFCVLLLGLVSLPRVFSKRATGMVTGNPGLLDAREVVIGDDGVRLVTARLTTAYGWPFFACWQVQSEAVVLTAGESTTSHLLSLPRRAMADGQFEQLVSVLEERLGQPRPAQEDVVRRWDRASRLLPVAALALGILLAWTLHDYGDRGDDAAVAVAAPSEFRFGETTYEREGGPVDRPVDTAGYSFTPGGGLVLLRLDDVASGVDRPDTLWVVDPAGVTRAYHPAR